MPLDIRLSGNGTLIGEARVHALKNHIINAVDDISYDVFRYASSFAPVSDPADKAGGSAAHIPSGTLKEHPVEIHQVGFSETFPAAAVGASGFRFRAPAGSPGGIGGQFIKGTIPATEATSGDIFYAVSIEYPDNPFYAKFVAFGTAGHGPATSAKYMKFFYKGGNYRARYVSGQDAQPYLGAAIEAARGSVDSKVGELRAEARFL